MTRNEIIDMMYNRRFIFNMESNNYGEPVGLHFLSEPVYERRDRTKLSIPAYRCTVFPETDQFEFGYTSSSGNIKLSTRKYDNIQDIKHFDNVATQFENSIEQATLKNQNEQFLLTDEDLDFGEFEQGQFSK